MNGKRILVPLDVEQNSFDGLEFVSGLADEMVAQVTLLHVVTLNICPIEGRIYQELDGESRQRLEALSKFFLKGRDSRACVRFGKPHLEILAEAEATRAELIVMASPRPRRWRWAPSLSIVERVVQKAPCLTLVLPRNWKSHPEFSLNQAALCYLN
jgi:nucleotide-binding universal stress UspA family protein